MGRSLEAGPLARAVRPEKYRFTQLDVIVVQFAMAYKDDTAMIIALFGPADLMQEAIGNAVINGDERGVDSRRNVKSIVNPLPWSAW